VFLTPVRRNMVIRSHHWPGSSCASRTTHALREESHHGPGTESGHSAMSEFDPKTCTRRRVLVLFSNQAYKQCDTFATVVVVSFVAVVQ